MQTLAKYFIALLLFLLTYVTDRDSPKEQLAENTIEQKQINKTSACNQRIKKVTVII